MTANDNYRKWIPDSKLNPEFRRNLDLASPNVQLAFYNAYFAWAAARGAYAILPDKHPNRSVLYQKTRETWHKMETAARDVFLSARNIGELRKADYTVGKERHRVADEIEFEDCVIGRDKRGVIRDYREKVAGEEIPHPIESVPKQIRYKAAKYHPSAMETENQKKVSSSLKEKEKQDGKTTGMEL